MKEKRIPIEVIERWLKDGDCDVRAAAINACQINNIPIPPTAPRRRKRHIACGDFFGALAKQNPWFYQGWIKRLGK